MGALGVGLILLGYALLLLVIIAGVSAGMYAAYVHWQHVKYSHLPGPALSSFFFGHFQTIVDYMTKYEEPLPGLFYEWYKEYGLIFKFHILHKSIVVCLDTKVVKEIMTNSKHTKTEVEYRQFTQIFGQRLAGRSLVSEWDHAKWAKRRALFNPAFQRSYLMGLMDVFNESADRLVDHLQKQADGATPVCMMDKFNSLTLDVIGKVGFGLDLNIIENPDCPLPSSAALALRGLQKSILEPWYTLIPTSHARSFRSDVREALVLFRKIGRDCIRERIAAKRRGEDLPKDILTYILDASEELKGSQDFGMEEMIDEFITFFIAGQETTGNHLSFTLQEICRRPHILEKILKEQEEVLGDKPYVEYQDLAKFEYLMLVMKESMRLFPPVSGLLRTIYNDMECCGYKVPKGTQVRINPYVMGKMEKYFDDPEEFRPERFRTITGEKPRHLYAYIPFSLGQRTCIGQNMAMMETRVILPKLLRRFNFELVPGQRYKIKTELTNKPIDGCKMFITPR